MLPNPLHPAIVHFPIVFMLLLPLVVAVVLWRLHDGARRRVWGLVIGTALVVSVSGLVALKSGQSEEDRVEEVVAEDAIHQHEEAAEAFLLVSWVVLGVAALGALPGVAGKAGRALTLVGSLALVGFGWRVGDLGGKLVYREGAAAAYTTTTAQSGAEARAVQARRGGDDEDEDR